MTVSSELSNLKKMMGNNEIIEKRKKTRRSVSKAVITTFTQEEGQELVYEEHRCDIETNYNRSESDDIRDEGQRLDVIDAANSEVETTIMSHTQNNSKEITVDTIAGAGALQHAMRMLISEEEQANSEKPKKMQLKLQITYDEDDPICTSPVNIDIHERGIDVSALGGGSDEVHDVSEENNMSGRNRVDVGAKRRPGPPAPDTPRKGAPSFFVPEARHVLRPPTPPTPNREFKPQRNIAARSRRARPMTPDLHDRAIVRYSPNGNKSSARHRGPPIPGAGNPRSGNPTVHDGAIVPYAPNRSRSSRRCGPPVPGGDGGHARALVPYNPRSSGRRRGPPVPGLTEGRARRPSSPFTPGAPEPSHSRPSRHPRPGPGNMAMRPPRSPRYGPPGTSTAKKSTEYAYTSVHLKELESSTPDEPQQIDTKEKEATETAVEQTADNVEDIDVKEQGNDDEATDVKGEGEEGKEQNDDEATDVASANKITEKQPPFPTSSPTPESRASTDATERPPVPVNPANCSGDDDIAPPSTGSIGENQENLKPMNGPAVDHLTSKAPAPEATEQPASVSSQEDAENKKAADDHPMTQTGDSDATATLAKQEPPKRREISGGRAAKPPIPGMDVRRKPTPNKRRQSTPTRRRPPTPDFGRNPTPDFGCPPTPTRIRVAPVAVRARPTAGPERIASAE